MGLPTLICWILIFNQKKSNFNPKWNFRKRKLSRLFKRDGRSMFDLNIQLKEE